MKKALIIEHPRHESKLQKIWEFDLNVFSYEYEHVMGRVEAEERLNQGGFNLVVIHHDDFSAVDYLRGRFPNIKYFGSSGNFFEGMEKETIGAEFCEEMKKHYDGVIHPFKVLRNFLKEMESENFQ